MAVQNLLKKVSFRSATDHLILTGDMIDKGPDSPGAVDLARELSASCVRGNHEDRMLLALNDMHAHHASLPGPQEDPGRTTDTLDEESFSHGDYKARALARKFTDKQVRWLQQCPVILRVGEMEGMGEVVVVHAGLVPGVPLERQDPFQAMNMRTIDLDTRLPSDGREGTPWEEVRPHAHKFSLISKIFHKVSLCPKSLYLTSYLTLLPVMEPRTSQTSRERAFYRYLRS